MSDLEFKQGDVVYFNFPQEKNPQHTIRGRHPSLILHCHSLPNNTVIISPLSSLVGSNGNEKELKSYHLKLLKSDYPQLKNDSYVKLDQIMTFSRNKLGKAKIQFRLRDEDISLSHLKLMESLQMQETFKEITNIQIERAINNLLTNLAIEKTD
ncbi:type II toxin-antitoxin system PemK/MazF family toxin [Bacillus safensis]|uniref:type II toxin-antitoxin system PemK/MazF family toxin n=1 Tax=Bacillus safensis TaxID=561879 RepID=UPI00227DEDCD|nr:type II toxin-antitoxin system PemK/MazF family toxin [Bacillus safensis]MCY7479815.1 type II toxin-antitoxin system PemK/MazF family toxin [Bacillus safensis]MCY7513622.1 type II toxin-antitoxin system PemK/MazF family toxin [Bacillus safensis]MED0719113.1 type II toxin-antitoxin system PemK/MazF family toxin [Bacillus safensis]MED4747498.1 type II toxin-antitoxin system PemK/MazF family toxin [Bacillus safensis]